MEKITKKIFLKKNYMSNVNFENFKKWPHFETDEIDAVTSVLSSGKVNRWTGTKNIEFEKAMCDKFGGKYSIALMNGTVSLELALEALGVGVGDEVITSCRTFMASASAVVMRGAKPIVADVDLDSQNITAQTISKVITRRTKAIIVVHLSGWACEMDEIMSLAKKHNLYVIEDCAQCHGALYKGKYTGTIGHIGSWSFCQDKIITTCGEGGAIMTNDEKLWRKMWSLKDHGKDFDAIKNGKIENCFKWMIYSFGTNFRMTEMQAAQGILALGKLDSWIENRTKNANMLNDLMKNFSCIRTTIPPSHIKHAYYKYCCFLRLENLKKNWSREKIISKINEMGIPCFGGTCWNISNEKCFVERGWQRTENDLPNATILRDTSLMFLIHPTLTNDDMKYACDAIGSVLKDCNI